MLDLTVSAVCAAHESALNYYDKYVLNEKDEPTPVMLEGIMVHLLLLEPEKFYSQYYTDPVPPEGFEFLKTADDLKEYLKSKGEKVGGNKGELAARAVAIIRETKENKLIWDQWMEENFSGKEYITKKKWDRLHSMRDRVLQHKFVAKYLAIGGKEVRIDAELWGHNIRGRVDWLVDHPDLPYIICIDLKKVRSVKFYKFRNAIEDGGLHIQAALYSKIIKKKYGRECLFVWLALEAGRPFHSEAYSANEAMLEAGEVDARCAIKRIEVGMATNVWPGYSDGMVQNMDLSARYFDQVAERESELEDDDEDGSL